MVGWRNVSWFRSNLWPVTLLNILKILEVPQSGVLHFSTRELIELTRYEESTINLFLMNLHVWSLNQKLYTVLVQATFDLILAMKSLSILLLPFFQVDILKIVSFIWIDHKDNYSMPIISLYRGRTYKSKAVE